jgi:hypothetical protein
MEKSTSRLIAAILIPEKTVDALCIGIGRTEMPALVITP